MQNDTTEMEVQPHGGALMRSGQPGRPKEAVRHALLERVSAAIARIEAMLDGTEPVRDEVFLKAFDICAKYGVGTQEEKIILDNALVPQALAKVLSLHEGKVLDQALAFEIARGVQRELSLE